MIKALLKLILLAVGTWFFICAIQHDGQKKPSSTKPRRKARKTAKKRSS